MSTNFYAAEYSIADTTVQLVVAVGAVVFVLLFLSLLRPRRNPPAGSRGFEIGPVRPLGNKPEPSLTELLGPAEERRK